MYNLYRSSSLLCLTDLFRGFFCLILCSVSFLAIAEENASFLNEANQIITQKKHALVSTTYTLWQEAFSDGFVLRQQQSDKSARTAFVEIQAELEGQMVQAMLQKNTKALWIIHTPLIATPVITEGAISEKLVAPSILADKDLARVNLSLERAKLIRLFLNSGGKLIVAYSAIKKEDKNGRTPLQIAIFEKLKKQYPDQIIDFPIESKHFSDGQFPLDKIGATYFFQSNDQKFSMTNRGLQINAPQNNATWGLWLQDYQHYNPIVRERFSEVISFLEQAGLREKIKQHCQQYHIPSKEIFSFFS